MRILCVRFGAVLDSKSNLRKWYILPVYTIVAFIDAFVWTI